MLMSDCMFISMLTSGCMFMSMLMSDCMFISMALYDWLCITYPRLKYQTGSVTAFVYFCLCVFVWLHFLVPCCVSLLFLYVSFLWMYIAHESILVDVFFFFLYVFLWAAIALNVLLITSVFLFVYLPTYLSTYLPTYLVQSISSCESDFLHVCPLLWINISALGTPFYPFQDIKRWQVLKWSSFTARVVTAKAVKINQDTPYRSLASKGKFGRVHFWRIVLWSYFFAHVTCKCVLQVHSWTVMFLRYCEENKSLWTFVERFC